jgi:hypothetical protein
MALSKRSPAPTDDVVRGRVFGAWAALDECDLAGFDAGDLAVCANAAAQTGIRKRAVQRTEIPHKLLISELLRRA